ncbi:MAG: helix-turn-helix transcriptional regulator [Chloroflexi bacterium]|nr:helix-turn-helix transcriptional regulator [Chloroflexota bacterium]
MTMVLFYYGGGGNVMESRRQSTTPNLTQREQEVLALLLEGLTNRMIDERLHLSTSTVNEYVSKLLRKFQIQRRGQLMARFNTIQHFVPENVQSHEK